MNKTDIGDFLDNVRVNVGASFVMPSDAIKWIAQKSDFHVDVQCRNTLNGPEYRATCNKCFYWIPMTREEVLALGRGFYTGEFNEFCDFHKHVPVVEEVVGRKFREEYGK